MFIIVGLILCNDFIFLNCRCLINYIEVILIFFWKIFINIVGVYLVLFEVIDIKGLLMWEWIFY